MSQMCCTNETLLYIYNMSNAQNNNDMSNATTNTPRNIVSAIKNAIATENTLCRQDCNYGHYYMATVHCIEVETKNGLGETVTDGYEIPRIPSQKMVRELQEIHSGSNRVFCTVDIESHNRGKFGIQIKIDLKTGERV